MNKSVNIQSCDSHVQKCNAQAWLRVSTVDDGNTVSVNKLWIRVMAWVRAIVMVRIKV